MYQTELRLRLCTSAICGSTMCGSAVRSFLPAAGLTCHSVATTGRAGSSATSVVKPFWPPPVRVRTPGGWRPQVWRRGSRGSLWPSAPRDGDVAAEDTQEGDVEAALIGQARLVDRLRCAMSVPPGRRLCRLTSTWSAASTTRKSASPRRHHWAEDFRAEPHVAGYAPPRWLMPWISLFFTSYPAAKAAGRGCPRP